MTKSKYRYKPVHAIVERLIELTAPLIKSRPKSHQSAPLRILILKFGGMGEAVLARSLVEQLRHRNPAMRFDFLVEKRTEEMMTLGASGRVYRYTPGSDGLLQALKVLRRIRKARYDAVLDFEQHSLLTAGFARASGVPLRIGFVPPSSNSRSGMFTHPILLKEDISMWHSFIKIGKVLDPGLPDNLMTVPLPCSEGSESWLDNWLRSQTLQLSDIVLMALHLGVGPSAQYRRWPVERFVDFAEEVIRIAGNVVFVLTGGAGEQALIQEFQSKFSGNSIDAADIGGLDRTAALLKRCDLLVCGDTGIMHLAAAMGTPTVGLFGPNTPVCWAPVGPDATFVYPTRQPCSPCINSYRRHIPQTCTASVNSACMWDITVSDVIESAQSALRKFRPDPNHSGSSRIPLVSIKT